MLTNTLRIMRALVLTLAAAAALSSCGGSSDAKPQTLPAVSSSPSSVATPNAAARDVPADAKAATSAGAEAFAKYFYAQITTAFATKDPDLIRAISAPGCTSCDNFIRSVTKLRDNNERVENFTVDVIQAVAPAVTDGTARVDVSWMTPDVAIRYDAAGKEIFRDGPYKRVDDEFKLTRQGDGWLVSAVTSLRRVK
jgi:hypothetical protein